MSDQAERICAGLARKIHDGMKCGTFSDFQSVIDGYARVLRESGLEDLLRAGRACRNICMQVSWQAEAKDWDAALARCEEKVKG